MSLGTLQVNNAPCSTCGSSNTTEIGMAEPTAAERPHAGRVELYTCTVCGEVSQQLLNKSVSPQLSLVPCPHSCRKKRCTTCACPEHCTVSTVAVMLRCCHTMCSTCCIVGMPCAVVVVQCWLWASSGHLLHPSFPFLQITRFPRYNSPGKLLDTRRGRWVDQPSQVSRPPVGLSLLGCGMGTGDSFVFHSCSLH